MSIGEIIAVGFLLVLVFLAIRGSRRTGHRSDSGAQDNGISGGDQWRNGRGDNDSDSD